MPLESQGSASSSPDDIAARFKRSAAAVIRETKENSAHVWERKVFARLALGLGLQTSVREIWSEHDNAEEVYKEMEPDVADFYLWHTSIQKSGFFEHIGDDSIRETEVWQFFLKVLLRSSTPVVVFRFRSGAIWVLTNRTPQNVKRLHSRIWVPTTDTTPNVQIMPLDLFLEENHG